MNPDANVRAVTVHPVSPAAHFDFNAETRELMSYIGPGGHVNIPGIINGVPVNSIANDAFRGNTTIISVTIPNSVSMLGNSIFRECSNLVEATLPTEGLLDNLPESTFRLCALTSIFIPPGITHIGHNVLNGNPVTAVSLHEGLTGMGQGAFMRNRLLTSLTIPSTTLFIDNWTFFESDLLRDVVFLGSTELHSGVFGGCPSLSLASRGQIIALNPDIPLSAYIEPEDPHTGDDVPDGMDFGKLQVFINRGLVVFADQEPVNVNNRVLVPVGGVFEALGYSREWEDSTKTAILSNEGFTIRLTIGANTFTVNGVSYALDVPAQLIRDRTMLPLGLVLQAIGVAATWDGDSQSVFITTTVESRAGACPPEHFTFSPTTGTIGKYIGPGGNVVIPNAINGVAVREIGTDAFNGITTVTSVVIPDTVTEFGQNVFRGATNLAHVVLPSNMTTITSGMFRETGLEYLNIPRSVTRIENNAISRIPTLNELYLHEGITWMGDGAIMRLPNLTIRSLPSTLEYIQSDNSWFFEGTNVSKAAYDAAVRINPSVRDPLTIVETYIDTWASDYTFNVGTGVIDKYVGSGGAVKVPMMINGMPIVRIASNAFADNENITSVILPDTILEYGEEIFARSPNLTYVRLPYGLSEVTGGMLRETALTSLYLPVSVTRIASNAISRIPTLTALHLHEGITHMGTGAIMRLPNVTIRTLPSTLIAIGGEWFFEGTNVTQSVYNHANRLLSNLRDPLSIVAD
jgi:hypothetical protein